MSDLTEQAVKESLQESSLRESGDAASNALSGGLDYMLKHLQIGPAVAAFKSAVLSLGGSIKSTMVQLSISPNWQGRGGPQFEFVIASLMDVPVDQDALDKAMSDSGAYKKAEAVLDAFNAKTYLQVMGTNKTNPVLTVVKPVVSFTPGSAEARL